MVVAELSNKLSKNISKNINLTKDQNEQMTYAIHVLIGESIKFAFLILLFFFLHKMNFFFFSLIILMCIRSNSGGIHFSSSIKCLILSTLIFLATSLVAPKLPRCTNYIYYILSFFNILIIYIKSPCPSINRPIRSKKRKHTLKILSALFTTIWSLILILYIEDTSMLNCGFCTITIQALQLIFIKKRSDIYEKSS